MSYVRKEVLAEGIEVYQADCLELLPTLGRFDAVVTDPPYGIGFEYASYEDTRENLRGLVAGLFAARSAFGRMVILCGPSQIHEILRRGPSQ